ncbi:hypothetical protein [Saliphagus infecundisoli]|uniref:Uncharacterized protein n=1 Tax=Saliphagus infecundisoli TaxID=1849069 RepID=A0ABD5QCE2_9EURY|nr:hypothetical protein [Saliphagus infecundisoli]
MDGTDNVEAGLLESVSLIVSCRLDEVASELVSMVVQTAIIVDSDLLTKCGEGGSMIRGCPECPEDFDPNFVTEQLES